MISLPVAGHRALGVAPASVGRAVLALALAPAALAPVQARAPVRVPAQVLAPARPVSVARLPVRVRGRRVLAARLAAHPAEKMMTSHRVAHPALGVALASAGRAVPAPAPALALAVRDHPASAGRAVLALVRVRGRRVLVARPHRPAVRLAKKMMIRSHQAAVDASAGTKTAVIRRKTPKTTKTATPAVAYSAA